MFQILDDKYNLTVPARTSFPSLEHTRSNFIIHICQDVIYLDVGSLNRLDFCAVNLSPPTSRMMTDPGQLRMY